MSVKNVCSSMIITFVDSFIYWSQIRLKPRNFIAASLENGKFMKWKSHIAERATQYPV
jgi:hypothetical protein